MLIPRSDFDVFDNFFGESFLKRAESQMRTDIQEREDSYLLTIDLPGYQKENIQVDVTNGYLTVHASSTLEDEDTNKYVRRERMYGECSRSFYIGDSLEVEDVKASFRNGTLQLEIPKLTHRKEEKKYIEIED